MWRESSAQVRKPNYWLRPWSLVEPIHPYLNFLQLFSSLLARKLFRISIGPSRYP